MSLRIDSIPIPSARGLAITSELDRQIDLRSALQPAFVAFGEGERNLERLFRPDSLCVTTGHQPALFTGPTMTIHKALSTVALARWSEQALNRPVIPVFWVAGDDHDFAESNHFHLLGTDGRIERITLRTRPADAPTTPLYQELLGSEIEAVFDRVNHLTPDSEFRAGLLAWLRRHYTPERDVATAFAGALAELLGRFGLVVFRPTEFAAKQAMSPWLLDALVHASSLDEDLVRHAKHLETTGHPVPVSVTPGDTLVLIESRDGRDRLVRNGTNFRSRRSNESWELTDLRHIAEHEPRRMSPNVLLRPTVEAALLPTLAYVAGPAESAYLAQAKPAYRILDVPPQAVVTRWSGRVVEQRTERVLGKYAIAPDELTEPEGKLEARLVSGDIPPSAQDALETLRNILQREYRRLEDAAAGVEPTMRKPVQSARNGSLKSLADLEKRLLSHLKQRNDVLTRQLAGARNALFPLRKPQERVLNALQYLVRYGDSYLDAIMASCETWADNLETTSGSR